MLKYIDHIVFQFLPDADDRVSSVVRELTSLSKAEGLGKVKVRFD